MPPHTTYIFIYINTKDILQHYASTYHIYEIHDKKTTFSYWRQSPLTGTYIVLFDCPKMQTGADNKIVSIFPLGPTIEDIYD